MLLTDIHVRAFVGPALKTYLHSVAKLRCSVLREYPYLAEPDLFRETNYLRKLASCKESIGVLVFDNTTIIGASFGIPLTMLDEFKKPFTEKQLDPNNYYFFSESTLLKNYRGRGIGHHLFDMREAHVRHLKKYKHICFCMPISLEKDPRRPTDDMPLNDFWRKRGYVHYPDIRCQVFWKKIGESEPSENTMTFWIKDLT
jgi:GNAT superfamily N-acetyltransferase